MGFFATLKQPAKELQDILNHPHRSITYLDAGGGKHMYKELKVWPELTKHYQLYLTCKLDTSDSTTVVHFPVNKNTFLLEDKRGYFISTKQGNSVSILAILKAK